MKNKQEKIISLGYPYYSKNTVLINDFEIKDNKNIKNIELLTVIIGVMVIVSLSTRYVFISENAVALTMDYSPFDPGLNPTYDPVYSAPRLPRRYRLPLTILGFFGSRMLGGELLLPPSQSMSTGYVIGYLMSWIIKSVTY